MIDTHPDTKSWSNTEKAQWFQEYSPLIWKCVRKFLNYFDKNPSVDVQDLYQIAAIAVLSAFDHYTPEKDTKFSSYAVICIENALKMNVRAEFAAKRPNNIHSLDDQTLEHSLLYEYRTAHNDSPEAKYEVQEKLELIYAYIEKKMGKDADVIFTVLCNELSQSNAAHIIQCSQSKISQNVKKIRQELQSEFQEPPSSQD